MLSRELAFLSCLTNISDDIIVADFGQIDLFAKALPSFSTSTQFLLQPVFFGMKAITGMVLLVFLWYSAKLGYSDACFE